MPPALGVIHVLVSGKPTEDGLPQHPDKSMPAILVGFAHPRVLRLPSR
jgi:hypothetical protein